MKNKLFIHYFIAFAAILVVLLAFYRLYINPDNLRYLSLTIIACILVAVGQFLIIRKKKDRK